MPIEHGSLHRQLLSRAVLTGDFVLADGSRRSWNIDVARAACDPQGMLLIADALLALLPGNVAAIGAPFGDANPIVFLTAAVAATRDRMLTTFVVEGTGASDRHTAWGVLAPGAQVALLDGVVFTGSSLIQAAHYVKSLGAVPVALIALLDVAGICHAKAAEHGLSYSYVLDKSDLGLP